MSPASEKEAHTEIDGPVDSWLSSANIGNWRPFCSRSGRGVGRWRGPRLGRVVLSHRGR